MLLPSWADRAAWVREFESGSNLRMVFGWNQWARSVCAHYKVDAIVDDRVQQSLIDNIPILRSSQIPDGAMVVSAVNGGRPITALKNLQKVGSNYLDYYSLARLTDKPLLGIDYWDGFAEDFARFGSFYDELLQKLADERSRNELQAVINFRLTSDLNYMESFVNREHEQYFEDFVEMNGGDTFLDVGAFDGLTSLEYARRNPNYGEIHAFEPSPTNAAVTRERLSSLDRSFVHEVVLGDSEETAAFSEDGTSSRVSDKGTILIPKVQLDSFDNIHPNFIKVDIEGGEVGFIRGAHRKLVRYQPAIAIAAYHTGIDIRAICEEMQDPLPDAHVYFRHYTEGFVESDLFFVPNK